MAGIPTLSEPIMTMVICSLTTMAPYYDCSEEWTLFIYENDKAGMIPCPIENARGIIGCANYQLKQVEMIQAGIKNIKDECGRTILLHELLHLKYENSQVHYECKNW